MITVHQWSCWKVMFSLAYVSSHWEWEWASMVPSPFWGWVPWEVYLGVSTQVLNPPFRTFQGGYSPPPNWHLHQNMHGLQAGRTHPTEMLSCLVHILTYASRLLGAHMPVYALPCVGTSIRLAEICLADLTGVTWCIVVYAAHSYNKMKHKESMFTFKSVTQHIRCLLYAILIYGDATRICPASKTTCDFQADFYVLRQNWFSYVVASCEDIFTAEYYNHININISAVWVGILLKTVKRQMYIII